MRSVIMVKRRTGWICVVAIAVLASGCSTLAAVAANQVVKAANTTNLEGKSVDKIEAELMEGDRMCPGQESPLVVTAHLADKDKSFVTKGPGEGTVPWDNFEVATARGEVSGKGIFQMASDPRETLDEPAEITVKSVHHPDKTTTVRVPAHYKCTFRADFSGEKGKPGPPGRDGARGDMDGGRGGDGGDGGKGGAGGHAPDVRVLVERTTQTVDMSGGDAVSDDGEGESSDAEATTEKKSMLKVRVESKDSDRMERYLVDPEGGRMKVIADGGPGGNGGRGGHGGEGGDGTDRAPRGGAGGAGGNGGPGGPGGDGGAIEMVVDPSADDYRDAIELSNAGGPGGKPGAPGRGGTGGYGDRGAPDGPDGPDGRRGSRAGRSGHAGPEPEIVTRTVEQVW
jgi:hypothetical protein